MAVIFTFTGTVPPNAFSDGFSLEPGTYTIVEDASGSSCNWTLWDITQYPNGEPAASGTGNDTVTFTTDSTLLVGYIVEAQDLGGPFNLTLYSGYGPPGEEFYVYEMEQGMSFDGGYIPHFLELNWYFGDDPVTYHSIQKIRIHGLTKGRTYLQVSTNGMQTDYLEDYTEAQFIDLPRAPILLSEGFVPITNYTDSSNRGIAIQMKFEGRNTDILRPEPAHVLQVLVVQSSPPDTGARAH